MLGQLATYCASYVQVSLLHASLGGSLRKVPREYLSSCVCLLLLGGSQGNSYLSVFMLVYSLFLCLYIASLWINWRDRLSFLLFTQFAGCSTKYFGTNHAELTKPKRDPA